jgi:hypothetical protein
VEDDAAGATVSFHRRTRSSFISSTVAYGRPASSLMRAWLKCVSEVTKST